MTTAGAPILHEDKQPSRARRVELRLAILLGIGGSALLLGERAPSASADASAAPSQGQRPRCSDVVSMYQADRATYADYGATFLAWGGTPRARSLEAAEGVVYFGSVGMVTEFARYHDRFPDTYERGLCRDIHGQPFKVPWLTDHQHRGVPYWWCCTQQPQFRQFLEERVVETLRAGAHGVHIDDHLGSAGALFLGGCFCDRCVEGFREHVAAWSAAERERLAIADPASFNLRVVLQTWLNAATGQPRRLQEHPLWDPWTVYQCRAAAAFMQHLRELAARTAGRPVPMSANAGVLWPRHLVDYGALDFLSAEIDHQAGERRLSDLPVFAYRLADAVDRPLAATASGHDWAFIKAENLPGLVQGWIALGYAAGHSLMAPHRQWCYTPEKGTHWYDGPRDRFAPLYRFVRQHATVFDDFEAYAQVVLVLPHRSFVRNRERWFEIGRRLSQGNVPWRLVLGGDELVDHPIDPAALEGAQVLLDPDPAALEVADRNRVQAAARSIRRVETVDEAARDLTPAVRVEGGAPVRVFPRVRPGHAVIHVINWDYRAAEDQVRTLPEVSLSLDLQALGVPGAQRARILSPGAEPLETPAVGGQVRIPALGLWSVLVLDAP